MKNSILSSVALAALLVSSVLTSTSLYSMQLNAMSEDSSDETESASEEQELEQPAGWGLRAFFVSQVAGARELLGYGRRAAGDLISQTRLASSSHEKKSEHNSLTLVKFFLNDYEKFFNHTRLLSRDMRNVLARYILKNHPLAEFVRRKLPAALLLYELRAGEFGGGVSFDPSGKKIVTNSLNSIKLWEAHSGQWLRSWEAVGGYCNSVRFQDANDEVLSVSHVADTEVLQFWDATSGECKHKFSCRVSTFSGDFRKLSNRALVIVDKSAKVRDVVSGECICKLKASNRSVRVAVFNRLGDRVVTVFDDGTAAIWDAATGQYVQRIEICIGSDFRRFSSSTGARFDGAGEKAVIFSNQCAQISDVHTGRCIHVIKTKSDIRFATFNKAGDKILITALEAAAIWDMETGVCVQTLQPPDPYTYFNLVALWNPSEELIVATFGQLLAPSGNGFAQIWDAHTGAALYRLKGVNKTTDIVFDAQGEKIAIAFADGVVRLWDLERLLALSEWLEKECSLEQALLLHCIYESRIVHALLKKRKLRAFLRFDFNRCPHLEEHFDTMPLEVQACLEPFIKRCSALRTRGRLPS